MTALVAINTASQPASCHIAADPQSESGLDDDSDDDSESDSGDDTEHDSKVENNTLVQFELSICAIPVAARACFTCSTMPLAEEKS